jgi:hypothetical protein
MKKAILLCVVVLCSNSLFSQNLISNPSFEEFVGNCNPYFYSDIRTITDFDSVPTNYCGLKNWMSISLSSNVYSTKINGTNALPISGYYCKYVYPHSDSSCIGLSVYSKGVVGNGHNVRMIVQGRLSAPLITNHQYKFSVWVQLFDTIYPWFGDIGKIYAVNSFSAYFSQQKIMPAGASSNYLLNINNYTPQVQIWQMVTDTQHWVLLQDTFIAAGGEQYISIGNFKPDNQIQTQLVDSIRNLAAFSYYFFDDVSLVDITPNGVESVERSNGINLYPNPADKEISIAYNDIPTNSKIQIINYLGIVVADYEINNTKSKQTISVENFAAGLYFCNIISTNGVIKQSKFTVTKH